MDEIMKKTEIMVDSLRSGKAVKAIKESKILKLKIGEFVLPMHIFELGFIKDSIKKEGDEFELTKEIRMEIINMIIKENVLTVRSLNASSSQLDRLFNQIAKQ